MNRKHPTVEVRPAAAPSPVDLEGDELSTQRSSVESDGVAPTVRQSSDDLPPTSAPSSEHAEITEAAEWSIPLPGQLIGDSYRVLGELGRGAMGVVLLALDQQLDRKVAIKLVRPELLGPGFRERFLEEARAMARVSHPNVVYVHAFGTHESVPYFVMEFVKGKTIESWLEEQDKPIDLDLALRIMNDVCTGVSAIHAAGTAHRDIKPSNILIDADLRVRITDFGVSTVYRDDDGARSEIVGTPAYMAPEIAMASARTGSVTPRADVYSLACVAYELLTGQLPFELDGEIVMMVRHATEPVPPPSTVRTDLPRSFDSVLLQALAKKPEERTATVELFQRALMDARQGGLDPVRILVAEDDDDFRDLLELKLRFEFPAAEIEGAADGRAALLALDKGTPSVAILDLQMPFMDGIALTALIRQREECRTMPIIVLTASGGPKEWKQLSSMGVDRFMVKPVNLEDVVAAIRNAIRERSSIVPPPSQPRSAS